MNLDWIKNIEDPEKYLEGDAKNLYEALGAESFIKLYGEFNKTRIIISERHLLDAKKHYILKNYDGANTRELMRILDVSEWYINQVIQESLTS
ncbi:hypothetical protein ACFLS9_09140 [Bacteroidota bacterium]